MGLCAGLSRRAPHLTRQSLISDIGRCMFGGSIACAALGPPYALVRAANTSWAKTADESFEISRSIWHNRLDIMTVLGLIGGGFFLRANVWQGVFGLSAMEAATPMLGPNARVWCYAG